MEQYGRNRHDRERDRGHYYHGSSERVNGSRTKETDPAVGNKITPDVGFFIQEKKGSQNG